MKGKKILCICEDVTEEEIQQAIAEGYDNIETLKRYTAVGMGPCQGKQCIMLVIAAMAKITGRGPGEIGITSFRPPLHPVYWGLLVAEEAEPK